jgi:hypothetical protein
LGTFNLTVTVTDSLQGTESAALSTGVTAAGATQPIPTLGEWTLALLAMLVAMSGVRAARRRYNRRNT